MLEALEMSVQALYVETHHQEKEKHLPKDFEIVLIYKRIERMARKQLKIVIILNSQH